MVQAESARPGTLAVVMEPLYEGGLSHVMPASICIANAYTNDHELLESGDLGPVSYTHLTLPTTHCG